MTTEDNNYVKRLREAASQWAKEHPGQLANQGGDLAGIDKDTGEDIIKTNEERAKQKESNIIKMSGKELSDISVPLNNIPDNTIQVSKEEPEPAKLPDNFKGISYLDGGKAWEEAQFICLSHGKDFDLHLPDELPPDILSKCIQIKIATSEMDKDLLHTEVFDATGVSIWYSIFPKNAFLLNLQGTRIIPDKQ